MKLAMMMALAVALSLNLASVASAQQQGGEQQTFTASLAPLNDSGASGTATVTVTGNQATFNIQASGLEPNASHPQALHIGAQNVCPPPTADTDGDGLISSDPNSEGPQFYGPIQGSLTTTGDVSPQSALAFERLPTADASGTVTYSRTFAVSPADTAADIIANGVIVLHGVDVNGNGTYDGPPSPRSASLPQEATLPAACGKLVAASGGGALPTSGGPSLLMPTGVALLLGTGIVLGLAVVRRRRLS